MSRAKRVGAVAVTIAVLAGAGVAGAAARGVVVGGPSSGSARLSCPGGMTRLGHTFGNTMSVFPADPAVEVSDLYTVPVDGFKVEAIRMGPHAGTHLDVPAHFVEGARTVDQLRADEFVWPVVKIDVRGRTFVDDFVQIDDIRAFEREHGRIPAGALVVLRTGAEEYWGAEEVRQADGLADNVDDLFEFANAGFSAEAVQWLFDARGIRGVGSDAYGPDAASDADFGATYTALANDGVALVALANLDAVAPRGDVVIASVVALENGSGFTTDPLACHSRRGR
jgi:kynurenine formamidase